MKPLITCSNLDLDELEKMAMSIVINWIRGYLARKNYVSIIRIAALIPNARYNLGILYPVELDSTSEISRFETLDIALRHNFYVIPSPSNPLYKLKIRRFYHSLRKEAANV